MTVTSITLSYEYIQHPALDETSFPPYGFSIFVIMTSFGAVLLQDETGDRTSDSLRLPFCRARSDVCEETACFTTASCGLSGFGMEPLRQRIGKRKCGDVFVI